MRTLSARSSRPSRSPGMTSDGETSVTQIVASCQRRRRRARAFGSRPSAGAGAAPTVRLPARAPRSWATSSRARRRSAVTERARARKARPISVNWMPRTLRVTSTPPSSSSNCRTLFVSAGWLRPSLRAAARMLPASTTARKSRIWLSRIDNPWLSLCDIVLLPVFAKRG